MRNAGLEGAQAGIKIAGRNSSNLRYAGDTILMAESEEELKSLLMKVKEESEKVGLKFNIQKTKIMASGPITSWQIDGKQWLTSFFWAPKSLQMVIAAMKFKKLLLGRKVMTNLDSILKSRDVTLSTKVHLVKATVFQWSCMDVRVGLWRKLSFWTQLLSFWCFWTTVLEKTLESTLDCKETQPVHPKGDQSWVFIGRTDAEAETPLLWPPHTKSWLIWKDPDAGKEWGREKKGTTDDKMVGWHHWLNGHGFGWTPRVGDGQGGLACCNSWGRKELDTTEQLNWTELKSTQLKSSTNRISIHWTLTVLLVVS